MTDSLALAAMMFLRAAAARRRAVRDALAAAFVSGSGRTAVSALWVSALVGVTLLQFVLPLLPWFGARPEELARIFLFAIQHLGDVMAGVLVVGQAGLAATLELWRARERYRFTSVAAAGMDPLELFVLPRVWGLALVYLVTGMMFKVTAVVVATYVNYAIDGRFLGAEIGAILEEGGRGILAGYVLNALVGCAVGAVCCAPVLAGRVGGAEVAPIGRVFRDALVLIFAAKLLFFVL